MVVPTVLAMMARRNWLRCTSAGNAPDAMSATAMAPPPLVGRSVGRLHRPGAISKLSPLRAALARKAVRAGIKVPKNRAGGSKKVPSALLLSRLTRGRTHALQAVGVGRRNRGAHDQP